MHKQLRQRIGLLACVAAATAFAACGGGGGGTDAGNGNTNGSSGTANTSGGGDGGSTSGGTTSGGTTSGGTTSGGGSDGGSTAKTYCDGVQLEADGGATFMLETFNFSKALAACSPKDWADGTAVQNAGGILDIDILDGQGPSTVGVNAPPVLYVASCDDLNAPAMADGGGASFPAPDAGSPTTVAAAVTAQTTGTFWGVVTAAYAGGAGKSSSLYVQDVVGPSGTPAPKSGVGVYIRKQDSATIATPNPGDVVVVTNFKWSPYNGYSSTFHGFGNNQNQFESQAGASIQVIGQTGLPPPVTVSPTDLDPTNPSATAQGYYGMRVTVSGGPFKVDGSGPSNTCPVPLQKTVTSSSGG